MSDPSISPVSSQFVEFMSNVVTILKKKKINLSKMLNHSCFEQFVVVFKSSSQALVLF